MHHYDAYLVDILMPPVYSIRRWNMSKIVKSGKQHFELTPGNARKLAEYLKRYNLDSSRLTPKFKIADVVNLALHRWLLRQRGRKAKKE